MSIWCSGEHIGTETTDMYEVEPGLLQVDIGAGTPEGTKVEHVTQGGQVLTYAEGFSNHHPDLTGAHERPATVDLAYAPSWCVPGHRDAEDAVCGCGDTHDAYEEVSPWARLTLSARESLSYWVKDEDGGPAVEPMNASVLLDEAAARALAEKLLEWADRPHLTPVEPAAANSSDT